MARQDYVDDLAQRFEHKVNPVVAEHACDAALPVAEWFDKRGLKVSLENDGGGVEQQDTGRDDGEAEGERTEARERKVAA